MEVQITLDPPSLAKVRDLALFALFLHTHFAEAMQISVDDLEASASAYMWAMFLAPTGALESDFHAYVYGWDQAELENWSEHAFRRNYGFSGMTDRLGRYFADDPGIEYMEYAVLDQVENVQFHFQWAAQLALIDVGAV